MNRMDFSGNFGIERETLRIDSAGRLAQTPHPFGFDPHITRDFCENQIELVTPVAKSVDEALSLLGALDRQVREVLAKNGETLWMYSNPPHFDSEDEIPIANFTGDQSSKRAYREVLQRKYGKKLMLFSGIHFNFSFTEEFLQRLNTAQADPDEFRDALYLRLYRQLMRCSFLLVLLTAASPWCDASLEEAGGRHVKRSRYASMRNGPQGYWNSFLPVLSHGSLQDFTGSIQQYVETGALHSASELYLPVRLKPRGVNSLEALAAHGVDHIELRMFDLNPAAPLGIDGRDLKFAHLLILYLITLPDSPFTEEEQKAAVRMHREAALLQPPEEILVRAAELLSEMEAYFAESAEASAILAFQREKLEARKNGTVYDDRNYYS